MEITVRKGKKRQLKLVKELHCYSCNGKIPESDFNSVLTHNSLDVFNTVGILGTFHPSKPNRKIRDMGQVTRRIQHNCIHKGNFIKVRTVQQHKK